MVLSGVLQKMISEQGTPIKYYLTMENHSIQLNQLIGKQVSISHDGYECMGCKADKKVFRQGHCYDCFYELPQLADWVLKPELSKAHLGIEERDLEFEKKVQLQEHIVYLSDSNGLKVGVTRKSQLPTRWIDQGSNCALEVLQTPNRYLAGKAEVFLKAYYSDKTHWKKMLAPASSNSSIVLENERQKIDNLLPEDLKPYVVTATKPTQIQYPIHNFPEKINSLNLQKTSEFTGTLLGVKGQYLIFEENRVFNVRSHEGFKVYFSVKN